MTRRSMKSSARRGFTLIEVLVVIGVVLLLMTISVAAGRAVIGGQKGKVTQSLLNTLDRALEEYITVNNGVIPAYVDTAYDMVPGPFLSPGVDNVYSEGGDSLAFTMFNGRAYPRFPDASVFLKQAKGTGVVDEIIGGIPESSLAITRGEENANLGDQDLTPSVIDAWGSKDWDAPWYTLDQQLILYVHPTNQLAQNLYGRCVNGRPYFLSAGPDKVYGNWVEMQNFGTLTEQERRQAVQDALKDNLMSSPVAPLDTANLTSDFNSTYRNR